MKLNVWSKVGVAVQTVLATAVAVTAVTQANPAVLSAVAHGYADGDVVLLRAKGMRQLDWAVVRVDNKTTDSFEAEGVDATDFDVFVSGTAQKITFGANAATFQDVSQSGGVAADIDVKTIHDDQDHQVPGNRSAVKFTFNSYWDISDPALQALAGFDKKKTPCAVAFKFATGDVVYFAAYASAPLAPAGSSGAPVTTPVALNLAGLMTTYAGA